MFEHIGKKLILHIPIGSFSLSLDILVVITSWVVTAILIGLAFYLRRGLRQNIEEKPNRIQAMLDLMLDFLRGQLTSSFASERLARELFPFISTLFLYILCANWISLIPYIDSPTKDLNVTIGLALMVFIMSHVLAVRMKGGRKYLKGFIEPYAFMLPINIVGEIAKPLSHSFRLFGNVFGGTIMLSIVYAFPITRWGLPVALSAFYGLFSGGIQAFVFAILAVAYINVAVES